MHATKDQLSHCVHALCKNQERRDKGQGRFKKKNTRRLLLFICFCLLIIFSILRNDSSLTDTQDMKFINIKNSRFICLLSIAVAIFWVLGKTMNVYHFDFVGALFELLWLPAILLLFGLPIISIIYWIKDKFNIRSLYLYSFLLMILTILFVIFYQHPA